MGDLRKEVLQLLENDSRLTQDQLAKLLNVSKEEIAALLSSTGIKNPLPRSRH